MCAVVPVCVHVRKGRKRVCAQDSEARGMRYQQAITCDCKKLADHNISSYRASTRSCELGPHTNRQTSCKLDRTACKLATRKHGLAGVWTLTRLLNNHVACGAKRSNTSATKSPAWSHCNACLRLKGRHCRTASHRVRLHFSTKSSPFFMTICPIVTIAKPFGMTLPDTQATAQSRFNFWDSDAHLIAAVSSDADPPAAV